MRILIVTILCVSAATASAMAQTPKEFYQRDFAGHPGKERKGPRQEAPPLPQTFPTQGETSGLDALKRQAAERVRLPDQTVRAAIPDETVELFPLSNEPGVKVEAIKGIIFARDGAHFESSVDELLALTDKTGVPLGEFYFVGAPKDGRLLGRLVGAITIRGGSVELLGTVPDQYSVNTSPSWIVVTPPGEVILEGAGTLSRFFNQRGEFVDPVKDPAPAPAPERKPNPAAKKEEKKARALQGHAKKRGSSGH